MKKLQDNVINTLKAKNYHGLDIDFEYINPEDGDALRPLYPAGLRTPQAHGLHVSSAVAPKTGEGQDGAFCTRRTIIPRTGAGLTM
jgi:spore germination protein